MRFGKFFLVFLIISALAFAFSGCADLLGYVEGLSSESSSSEEEIEYTEDYYDRRFMDEVLSDEEKRENIFAALTDININTEFIKDFAKIEDESGEEKYSFTYRENNFIVYLNPDSTISSVKIGEDGTDIYLEGYEPYDADDYLVTESMVQGYSYSLINAVEIAFNYPEIYEFAGDWVYKHEEPFYYASGTVLIGEEKASHYISMITYYEEAENTMHWYSLEVDGKKISLPAEYEEPVIEERQPISGE